MEHSYNTENKAFFHKRDLVYMSEIDGVKTLMKREFKELLQAIKNT
jgi:hypothetical protein